jgi:hypothetical protein
MRRQVNLLIRSIILTSDIKQQIHSETCKKYCCFRLGYTLAKKLGSVGRKKLFVHFFLLHRHWSHVKHISSLIHTRAVSQ